MVGRVRLLTVGVDSGLFNMVQPVLGLSDELVVTTSTSFLDALFSMSARSNEHFIANFHLADHDGMALERADRAQLVDNPFVLCTGSSSQDQLVETTALGAVPCSYRANGPTRWHDELSEAARRAIRRANSWNPSESDWLPGPSSSIGPPIGPGRIQNPRFVNLEDHAVRVTGNRQEERFAPHLSYLVAPDERRGKEAVDGIPVRGDPLPFTHGFENPAMSGEGRRTITSTSKIASDRGPASLVAIQKTSMQSSSDGLGED